MSVKKPLVLVLVLLLLTLTANTLNAHVMTTGVSRWCFGKDYVLIQIDLDSYLLAFIKGIQEGHYNPDSIEQKQLPQIAAQIIQPYIDNRLRLTVNDSRCALRVTRLTKNGNNLFTIWLCADNIALNRAVNLVKIDYRLLFEETGFAHQNLASMYTADGPKDTVQKIFDYSPPQWQAIFDPSASEWVLSINGPADTPEGVKKQSGRQQGGDNAAPAKEQSSITLFGRRLYVA